MELGQKYLYNSKMRTGKLKLALFLFCAFSHIAFAEDSIQKVHNIINQKIKASRNQNSEQKKDRYYLVSFATQNFFNKPENSHTWATFIRVPASGKAEVENISWLPADFAENRKIDVFNNPIGMAFAKVNSVQSEMGKNFSLEDTIKFVTDAEQTIKMKGPEEIGEDLFKKLHDQKKLLESESKSGGIRYKADDRLTRDLNVGEGQAINCFHAFGNIGGTKMAPGGFLKTEYNSWGLSGTLEALEHLRSQWPDQFFTPNNNKDIIEIKPPSHYRKVLNESKIRHVQHK